MLTFKRGCEKRKEERARERDREREVAILSLFTPNRIV